MANGDTVRPSRVLARVLFDKQFFPVFLLLLLAIALLVLGVWLGENGLVERNAHYLCLDCLGIG